LFSIVSVVEKCKMPTKPRRKLLVSSETRQFGDPGVIELIRLKGKGVEGIDA